MPLLPAQPHFTLQSFTPGSNPGCKAFCSPKGDAFHQLRAQLVRGVSFGRTKGQSSQVRVWSKALQCEVRLNLCDPGITIPIKVLTLRTNLPQLEVLTLGTNLPESIAMLKGVPELIKLKELFIRVGVSDNGALIELTSFLNSCPNLQQFTLQLSWLQPLKTNRDIEKATKCSLKYLKVIELSGYYGNHIDLNKDKDPIWRVLVRFIESVKIFLFLAKIENDGDCDMGVCSGSRVIALITGVS
ncbi:hypothetical protein ACH5RR_026773 [Cinchona calisaya]|uniref:Uncharacterized protein n=1 Tax=Cinchona calisaya TaxID=153742 RepID=A0ABD2Z3K0_9GENT